MKHITFLLAFLIIACAPSIAEAPVSPSGPTRSVRTVIHGDTRFSVAERFTATAKTEQVYDFTGGHAELTFVWDLSEATYMRYARSPRMIRVPASEVRDGIVGTTRDGRIGIAADVCRSLDACILHEIGHFIGMGDIAAPGNVMSLINAAPTFTEADRAECVRVGMCAPRRRPDVTTVTVSIDPAIPRVEPDYPRPAP